MGHAQPDQEMDDADPRLEASAQSFCERICGAISAMMAQCDENSQSLLVNAMVRCARGNNPAVGRSEVRRASPSLRRDA